MVEWHLVECYVTVRMLGGVIGANALMLAWATTMCIIWIVRDQQQKSREL